MRRDLRIEKRQEIVARNAKLQRARIDRFASSAWVATQRSVDDGRILRPIGKSGPM
jgi:hypothetical protein